MRCAKTTVSVLSGFAFAVLLVLSATACDPVIDPGNGDGGDIVVPAGKDPLDIPPEGFVDEPDDGSADIDGLFTYGVLARSGHPRLLMNSHDFVDLKNKLSGEAALDYVMLFRFNKLIIDVANSSAEDPAVIKISLDASGKRNLEMSRLAMRRLFSCSYAYRVTGKKKYLDKVVSDLAEVCAMPEWHPSHFLDVGEMAFGVAVAYDWLYYSLDYKTRTSVRKKLDEYALKQSYGQSFHKNKGNWNQVCNAGIIAAAIVTYEQNRSDSFKAIEDGVSGNLKAVEAIYSPDGNYAEGYSYWSYGTGYQTVIITELEKAFGHCCGIDKISGFMDTSSYMLFMAGTAREDFSYADGGSNKERAMLPMWWFAARRHDSSLLANEMRLYDKGNYPGDEDRFLPFIPCVIKDFKFDPSAVSMPSERLWTGSGLAPVAMVHTNWTFGKDDCYLGVKGGGCGSSHPHMDAGSFVFDALGLRWSEDYQRPNYAEMEVKLKAAGGDFWGTGQKSLRWDILKMNNLSHSTLAFTTNDGSVSKLHATDQLVSGKAEIVEKYDEADRLGVRINLSSTYADAAESVFRTLLVRDGGRLEVIDEIHAKASVDASLQWRMNTPSTDNTLDGGRIVLCRDGKKMSLRAVADKGSAPTPEIWDGRRPSSWTARSGWDSGLSCKVVGWTATVPAGQTVKFTTVLEPLD